MTVQSHLILCKHDLCMYVRTCVSGGQVYGMGITDVTWVTETQRVCVVTGTGNPTYTNLSRI